MLLGRFVKFSEQGLDLILELGLILLTGFLLCYGQLLVFGYIFKYLYCQFLTLIDVGRYDIEHPVDLF